MTVSYFILSLLPFFWSSPPAESIEALHELMTGSFSSAEQAEIDSNYYNITLHMYPIWEGQGHWLYVEQAVASMPDKPYRQRVYELNQLEDGRFSSKVYTLAEPERFIGTWNDAAFFNDFDTSILEERDGCAVMLAYISENHYAGSTQGKACRSSLRGASYATSKVVIQEGFISSWDQGFDAEDQQVWGATEGPYEFRVDPDMED